MNCISYCTAGSYQFKRLQVFLKSNYIATFYRDVIHVAYEGNIFFFPYGCIIFWNVSDVTIKLILEQVKEFEQEPLSAPTMDYFNYLIGETTGITPEKDLIYLQKEDPILMLAMSFALAQSIKLVNFEDIVEKTIKSTEQIPQDLASKGKISLSQKAISQRMGNLFLVRNSINLNIDFLDTAEFFWENPGLEIYHIKASSYLDIQKRVDVLNKRLDVIHNLFNMLNNELHHQHSSTLELIIIYLIVIEICLVVIEPYIRFRFGH